MLVIVAAGVALSLVLVWFYALETSGRRHTILVVVVVVVTVEAIIAGYSAQVPVGILRPRMMGQDFRPPDLLLVAAMAARLLVGGVPRRVSVLGGLWTTFLVVYGFGVVIGFINGLPTGDVLFQGKAAFYLAGGAVVASGADVARLPASIVRLGVVLAPVVPVSLLIRLSGVRWTIDTPIQRLNGVGLLSNDSITILVVVGAMVLVVEACAPRPRLGVLVAGIIMVLAPLAGTQRASYVALAAVGVVLVLAFVGPTWRRRSSIGVLDAALVGSAFVAVVITGFLITASPGLVVSQVESAFGGLNERRSADERITLYREAMSKIAESPVIGSGVGTTVMRTIESTRRQVPAAAHNVIVDLWLRVGVVGVVLFVAAIAVAIRLGIGIWRGATDGGTASVALGCVIALTGVLAKAMLEPAIDKFRLSIVLGLAVGGLMALRRAVSAREPASVSSLAVGAVR